MLRDGSDQLDITDVEHDAPIGREVLVRSVAAGLCHSDYHYLDGTLKRPRPVILGHEGAGIVEAVGPDVRDIRVGDHVVTCLVMGCGECARCQAGEPTRCLHREVDQARPPDRRRGCHSMVCSVGQMANVGSLADHILLDERAVTAISADIPMELACILGCAVVTGLGAALNTADVQPGESVVVIGCGGVGLNVIQGARIAGASPIIAVDANPDKLATRHAAGRDGDGRCIVDRRRRRWSTRSLAAVRTTRSRSSVAPHWSARHSTWSPPGRTAYVLGIQSDDAELTLPVTGFPARQEGGRRVHGRHRSARRHPHVRRPVARGHARPQRDGVAHAAAGRGEPAASQ